MTRKMLTALALGAAALTAPTAQAAEPTKTVVLVHGAFADGSGWRGVYDILVRDGFKVRIVQQPMTGLADDVAATQRVLDQQSGPVVLVGHSYGGVVITAAGAAPKVKALVYVASVAPDVGESMGQLLATAPAPSDGALPSKDGYLFLAPEAFPANFAADLPKDQAEFMAASQMPAAFAALGAPTPTAAWRDKPSYGIVAVDDRAIAPDLQRRLYARAKAKVTDLRASHAVYISQPRAVAEVIEAAARAVD